MEIEKKPQKWSNCYETWLRRQREWERRRGKREGTGKEGCDILKKGERKRESGRGRIGEEKIESERGKEVVKGERGRSNE